MAIKQIIRGFSLWLFDKTNSWVVPYQIWEKLDREENINEELERIRLEWAGDPEITRVQTMVHFTEDQKMLKEFRKKDLFNGIMAQEK